MHEPAPHCRDSLRSAGSRSPARGPRRVIRPAHGPGRAEFSVEPALLRDVRDVDLLYRFMLTSNKRVCYGFGLKYCPLAVPHGPS